MATESHKLKIAVMGTGGLGGYFGGTLARAGEDVTFIARGQQLEAMAAHGLQVFSIHGDFEVNSVQVTDSPDKVGVVDLLLFCVKSYDADAALQLIKPMVGAETVVIPVLNGIEHITAMQAALGDHHVLGGVAAVSVHRSAPGVVRHVSDMGPIQLEFGEWPTGESVRCERIQAVLAAAGLKAGAVPNISERMWRKFAIFCGTSVLAVMRGPIGRVWSPEAEAVLVQTSTEAVAVAAAQGIALPKDLPNIFVGWGSRMPPDSRPSISRDLEQGHRLEMEAITGVITRLGKKSGVPTPYNDFVYACLKPYVNGS